jgi:hypothetical protein
MCFGRIRAIILWLFRKKGTNSKIQKIGKMAKLTGALKIKGTLKSMGITFVEGRNGIFLRAMPKVVTEKSESFKEHTDKEGTVARLAGQVNRIFKQYARANTGQRMYTGLLKRLQKVQPRKRFFRLVSLVKLESHTVKNIRSINADISIDIQAEGYRLKAAVENAGHPTLGKNEHFYRLEMIVAYWTDEKTDPQSMEQHSKWIVPGDALKGYDFIFDLPENCLDWLMLFRCRLAERKDIKGYPPTDIVQIVDAGSFDEAAVAELKEYFGEKKNVKRGEVNNMEDEDDGVEGRERN